MGANCHPPFGQDCRRPTKYAILTDEIYKGTFDLTAKEYKGVKSLDREDNLRDHMEDLELILTMLGEATTIGLTRTRDSKDFPALKGDTHEGGEVSGKARLDIEKRMGKKVTSGRNFLPPKKR